MVKYTCKMFHNGFTKVGGIYVDIFMSLRLHFSEEDCFQTENGFFGILNIPK